MRRDNQSRSSRVAATIAAEVGFTNLSLFNRQFARAKGDTPSHFRKRHRGMLATLPNLKNGIAMRNHRIP